jgi:Arc-like DNA binding domain
MRARIGKKENVTRLMVRLPESLHRYLTESARQSSRSLNYEVVTRLRASIELDRLLKIDNADEALVAMTKLKHRLIDLRLQDSDE